MDCWRINLDEVEACVGCGGDNFEPLNVVQETNDIEPYIRKKDDNNNKE